MRKIYRKIYRFMNYIYKVLLQFCLWCEIPLKLLKVYIINVQDCRFWKEVIFPVKKSLKKCSPLENSEFFFVRILFKKKGIP